MPSLSEETGGRVSMLMPGSTIGIIGGGQLGRMMALSARYMGFRVGVLDPTPNCPTGQVADFQITAEYDDRTAIHDLAVQSDVLTYEFENVDADAIDEVRGITATPQGTDLLRVTQHRVHEKRFINDHGTATAPWRAVNNFDELDAALDDIHYPAVLKTVSGGYDGHGQLVLRSDADLEKIRSRSDRGGGFPPSILEGFVDFAFEASILVSGNGKDFVTFPIVRNEHRNNILHMTIAPAEVSEHVAREAHELAIRLAKGFELAGTLAIELFITKDDQVIVNELAPRPHNSGHYTIEACSMDQFDAHIRGIAGWPLPKPKLLSPAVMVNVLGQHVEPTRALIATHPEWNVHDYGKAEVRHDRKMGHITVLTDDPAKTVADLEATGCWDDLKKKACQTKQKDEIRAALADCEEFISAQDLHRRLEDEGSKIGLATVYRQLNALADAGAADTIRLDGQQLFRLCGDDGHHHHLVCRRCGKTVEIDPPSEAWLRKVADGHGFTVESHTLEVFGLCSDCQKEQKAQKAQKAVSE